MPWTGHPCDSLCLTHIGPHTHAYNICYDN